MGRPHRLDCGGYLYHVLNRANVRLPIFQQEGDYRAFERIACEALDHVPGMRLLAYCVLPNHWHLLLWPLHDSELADFVHWLTLTHTQRWHAHNHDVGSGHLYQGRYKKAPAMCKNAPAGAINKRGRTDPVNDPDLLVPDLNPFHLCPDDLPPSVPGGLV